MTNFRDAESEGTTTTTTPCEQGTDSVLELTQKLPSWDTFGGSSRASTRTNTTFSRSSTLSRRIQGFHNDLVLLRNRLLNGQRKRRDKSVEKAESLCPLYEAESPDELALVYAARAYGVSLLSRSVGVVTVALPYGNEEAFEILKVLPFDSSRFQLQGFRCVLISNCGSSGMKIVPISQYCSEFFTTRILIKCNSTLCS
ncbi:unnamed protein product [Toxocara canis]|uniref:Pentatricopeptide repeat-containing protein n=1 Tax=Toxocara canis TaxID=6265 RepID=A0A183U4W1_TOXCA|nr:unnamed protein product [Toxocara canis]